MHGFCVFELHSEITKQTQFQINRLPLFDLLPPAAGPGNSPDRSFLCRIVQCIRIFELQREITKQTQFRIRLPLFDLRRAPGRLASLAAGVSCAELCTGFEFSHWTRRTAEQTQFRITGCRCSTCCAPAAGPDNSPDWSFLCRIVHGFHAFELHSGITKQTQFRINQLPLLYLRFCRGVARDRGHSFSWTQ